MSGLEKFQANDAWRTHFKNLLLVERKITPQIKEPVKQSQRFSLDIADDLAIILEEKKIPRREQTANNKKFAKLITHQILPIQKEENTTMFQTEDKENITADTHTQKTPSSVKFAIDNLETFQRYSAVSQYDETVLDDLNTESPWQRTSDESFEAMEKMCNKTASDPDSTLFQYLHSEQKDKIVQSAKNRSRSATNETPKSYDAEANALQRLLDELRVEEQLQLENESPLKGVDVTALEDIEAPSRLWENTFTNETILQTSPVKMVGLLRPSTILEEYDGEDVSSSSEVSSQMSFQSATKGVPSEVSSSCYETANTSTTSSVVTNKADKLIEIDEDEKITDAENPTNTTPPSIVITPFNQSFSSIDAMLDEFSDKFNNSNDTIDLIDLEKTFAPLRESPHSSILEETISQNVENDGEIEIEQDEVNKEEEIFNKSHNVAVDLLEQIESSDSSDSVIEILSDEDEDDNDADVDTDARNFNTSIKIKHENISTKNVSLSTSSSNSCRSPELDDYKENYPDLEISANESLHFNDTMEEVAYMMEKGKQYLAAASNSANKLATTEKSDTLKSKSSPSPSPLKSKQNTFLLSPKADSRYRSPSPMLHKQKPLFSTSVGKAKTLSATSKTAERPIARPKPINNFSKEMKPFPKLDLFKKPSTSTIPTNASMRHKEVATKHFSHIVSPIRAYIKKSTNTPLMFMINDMNKNPNSLNSMQALENESRLYKPNFEGAYGTATSANVPIAFEGPSGLPKKAYISSEFKHIVDERTPVTIPGGKQFQKHIETAMLPAVLKHEGKMKMPGMHSAHSTETTTKPISSPATSRRTDASLADLSVMSGDISMYTIKDARKF